MGFLFLPCFNGNSLCTARRAVLAKRLVYGLDCISDNSAFLHRYFGIQQEKTCHFLLPRSDADYISARRIFLKIMASALDNIFNHSDILHHNGKKEKQIKKDCTPKTKCLRSAFLVYFTGSRTTLISAFFTPSR